MCLQTCLRTSFRKTIPVALSGKARIALLSMSVLLLAAAVLYVYVIFDPEDSVFFPKCIFYTLTGLKCPGCGTQRALHQLLNGNLIGALRYNALAVVAMPYILLGIFLLFSGHNHITDFLRKHLYEGRAVYVAFAVIVMFFVIRNIVPGL